MYQVTMSYENLIKYYEVYSIDSGGFYLHSINKNISEYMKNIITYRNDKGPLINFKITLEENEEISKGFFYQPEIVIFEFDTEEEAFYFKLKFC